MSRPPRHLADLELAERREAVAALGERAFRADQLSRHYFARYTDSPEDMTDLPIGVRTALAGELPPGCELVVKLGARGVRAAGTVYPARPTRPVDPTGAGDAFAAGYLVGGIMLGLEAAARAVATMGAMP